MDTTKRLCTPFQFMYKDLDRSDKYVRQTIHTKNAERWWSRSFSKVVFFLIAKRRQNLNSQTTIKRKTTNENSETATKITQACKAMAILLYQTINVLNFLQDF